MTIGICQIPSNQTEDPEEGSPFLFEVTTTNPSDNFELPLTGTGEYNFTVDWGDGSSDTITAWNDAEAAHVYADAGVYDVTVEGQVEGWSHINTVTASLVSEIKNWGQLSLGTGYAAFSGCSNMTITATDQLNSTGLTNLDRCFRQCSTLNEVPGLGQWDITQVTTALLMFDGTGLTTANYDATLVGWAAQSVQSGVTVDFGTSQYSAAPSAAASARAVLVSAGWTITDNGPI